MSSIAFVREVAAPPEVAVRAFLDAEVLRRWWWPHLPDTTYDVDAVPGGTIRVVSAAAGIGFQGVYATIAPAQTSFSFQWLNGTTTGDEEPDQVEVTAHPADDGTSRLTLVHTSTYPLEANSDLAQGWSDVLDRLAALTW